jgi:hypothetical protein
MMQSINHSIIDEHKLQKIIKDSNSRRRKTGHIGGLGDPNVNIGFSGCVQQI